jgi:polysaccharide export outer membrane protein
MSATHLLTKMSDGTKRRNAIRYLATKYVALIIATLSLSSPLLAQEAAQPLPAQTTTINGTGLSETAADYNAKLAALSKQMKSSDVTSPIGDYLIGPEDLLEITVLEAPDFNRTVRVSDDGAISLALLGEIQVAGMSTREVQLLLEDRLRQTYMKDPQVGVFVQEMRSHPVAVFGAVDKPGVYQIRYAKPLVEVLSMAQGLATDAGDTVIVERHSGDPAEPGFAALLGPKANTATDSPNGLPATSGGGAVQVSGGESITLKLKDLLDSSGPHSNVLVYPGDSVKVTRAGIVYVLGQVHKPGGFVLKTNEDISVLQAIAFAEGTTPNAKGKNAMIFVASPNGERKEVAINLDKIMAGKEPSPVLKPNDVLFVPNSGGKEALHVLEQSSAGIVGMLGGAAIYRW